ncbi:MAG TPA: hypothetical protein VKY40_06845 [Halanaerobiales bacterium]|nr:hypothetical protein [Halanaerobiales bacterium]
MEHKRISIFTGNYGSGKTELAINFSLFLKKRYKKIMLIDLDVINPYFRSREKAEFLEKRGIKVIYPANLHYADLPVVPADVYSLLQNKKVSGVIDAGGDKEGATALGSISRKLVKDDYEMNLVVNTYRDRTEDVEGIINTARRIEEGSRLQIDNLICNVNLGRETLPEHIKKGYQIIQKAAEEMAIPIKFIAVREDILPVLDEPGSGEEIFPLRIFMKLPWEV